ncbi:MAG: nucleoside phosphorylase [Anaerolineae bacterium]|nr:nucleoside phosphorylase [Anaerolineae bacterium]
MRYPILEYDPNPNAIIQPGDWTPLLDSMPERCVFCFFQEVIRAACSEHAAEVIHYVKSEMGANPVYVLEHGGQRVAVIHPGVGAPLAAGFLEEAVALGGRKFVVCGGAGVLDRAITAGHVIVPLGAVRDEGTSYHYLPPAREVAAADAAVAAIKQTLEAHDIPYLTGKTWTTDAFYRETPGKVAQRRAEGCLTVEMEAAAFFAVAQFRGVALGQILYGGDDVSGEAWDARDWIRGQTSTRAKLFWLAVEAALRV